ncbi:MAG TPA: hypothetical protein V6D17_04075 [Candidatus Obscuribacterales bacterium]
MRLRSILQLSAIAIVLLSASQAKAQQTNPIMRETIGTIETRGWERTLIKGNPNLKHWHWNPIYSTVHGYKRVKPGSMKLRQEVYFKPIKEPPEKRRYPKQNHVAFPIGRNPDGTQRPNPTVSSKLVSHDLNGVLMRRQAEAQLKAKQVEARLAASKVEGRLAAKQGQAELLAPKLMTYEYRAPLSEEWTPACGADGRQTRSRVYGQIASRRYSQSSKF